MIRTAGSISGRARGYAPRVSTAKRLHYSYDEYLKRAEQVVLRDPAITFADEIYEGVALDAK